MTGYESAKMVADNYKAGQFIQCGELDLEADGVAWGYRVEEDRSLTLCVVDATGDDDSVASEEEAAKRALEIFREWRHDDAANLAAKIQSYGGVEAALADACGKLGCSDLCDLASVGGFDWDSDDAPWNATITREAAERLGVEI